MEYLRHTVEEDGSIKQWNHYFVDDNGVTTLVLTETSLDVEESAVRQEALNIVA